MLRGPQAEARKPRPEESRENFGIAKKEKEKQKNKHSNDKNDDDTKRYDCRSPRPQCEATSELLP